MADAESNAIAFGKLYHEVRATGWQLGLLVARSVRPGKAGRPPDENRLPVNDLDDRVTMHKFAELAGVSVATVSIYWRAWDLAAVDGIVQSAMSLGIGEDDMPDDERLDDWSDYYHAAKQGSKDQKPSETSKSEPSEQAPADSGDDGNHLFDQPKDLDAEDDSLSEDVKSARGALKEVKHYVSVGVSAFKETGETFGHVLADPALGSIMREIGEMAMDLAADIETRLLSQPETT